MRQSLAWLSLVLLLVAPVSASAQADQCSCNAALLDGVYSSRVIRNDSNARLDVVSRLQSMTYEEFRDALGASGGASFLGFGFSANMTRDQFQRRQSELRTEHALTSSTVSNQQLFERYGDEVCTGQVRLRKAALIKQSALKVSAREIRSFKIGWR